MKTRLIRSVLSDGDGEKSSLSFSCLVMLSLGTFLWQYTTAQQLFICLSLLFATTPANFFAENWDYAMELFYKVRPHAAG